jgi:hypothetical protein
LDSLRVKLLYGDGKGVQRCFVRRVKPGVQPGIGSRGCRPNSIVIILEELPLKTGAVCQFPAHVRQQTEIVIWLN